MKQHDLSMVSNNEAFILQHRLDDVRSLALKKMPEGVDAQWCLQQIEGWQLARKKLPRWAASDGVCFPPRISLEQCSSEQTAGYKKRIVERLLSVDERVAMADLTGGFGIDFSYMAPLFRHALYVEQQPHLCDIARHNFPLLGLHHSEILNAVAENGQLPIFKHPLTLIYLDPARRNDVGRKVVALEDCTPNVVEMLPTLKACCRYVIVKLSPMLDITHALRQLPGVVEVHVVSVQGECKELLLVIDAGSDVSSAREDFGAQLSYYCVNIKEDTESVFVVSDGSTLASKPLCEDLRLLSGYGMDDVDVADVLYLYEPNASVLKAGVQYALPSRYPVLKLHPQSNLYISRDSLMDFPGRMFRILTVGDFSKRSLKRQLAGMTQANLTIRNFPSTVAVLRKQLKLKEGGDDYLFATTLSDSRHALIHCRK